MPNGYGYGFGFRGASPPWPYIGRGRGGLPRCWYLGLRGAPPYLGRPGARGCRYYWGPLAPAMTREQELGFLKDRAKAIREELEDIEARIRDLEAEKKE